MSSQVFLAIEFATKKHNGQVRKISGEPYITHPIKVSYLLASYKKSKSMDDLICAALLHDTLEDTNTQFIEIATTFTPLVASLVLELTNNEDEIAKIGKKEHQKRKLLGISKYALTIKLVDILANIMDNPTTQKLIDMRELMEFIVANRELSGTQHRIVHDINKILGGVK